MSTDLKIQLQRKVIDFLVKNAGRGFNYKQVAARIGANDQQAKKLVEAILEEERKKGIIKAAGKGRYEAKHLRSHLEGVVDMAGNGSAYVVCEESPDDVFVAPGDLKGALHGDRVQVQVYAKRSGKRLKGEIVKVLKRSRTGFTGVFKDSGSWGFVIPDFKKMHSDIFIPPGHTAGARDGDKVYAEITQFTRDQKNPVGNITEILGKPGEHKAEMDGILMDSGFPSQFSKDALALADSMSTQPGKEQRQDFRDVLTFTIDPEDAKDFDDALSFKQLGPDEYQIGIHIADVSHYVKPGSALDKEAYERATSVYMVDRVISMLPERLSNDLCSLKPHEDRLCYAVVCKMNSQGHVLDHFIGRTHIHSDQRFTYEQAQELLEKDGSKSTWSHDTATGPDYIGTLQLLNKLAGKLREQRFKQGAIAFETLEFKFKLDPETSRPIGLFVKERKDAHKLIEEFMLLANRLVAEKIGKHQGKVRPFVYRVHEPPEQEKLEDMAKFASRFGYSLGFNNPAEVSRSINSLMEQVTGKPEQAILSQMAVRTMSRARYTTDNLGHYGLAFKHYSHFTSPIRRYPDILVHRLLDAYLYPQDADLPVQVDGNLLEKQCRHCTEQEGKATDAERQSVKYKQAEYLQDHIGEEYEGLVTGVTEWGIFVEMDQNHCEGMCRLRSMEDDFYSLSDDGFSIVGQRSRRKIGLGDKVRVRIAGVSPEKKQIDLELL